MMTAFDALAVMLVCAGIALAVGVLIRTPGATRLQELLGFGDEPEWMR